MPLFQAIVLGAVQGLTEFVPISSSGHLVLVPAALDWDPPGLAFDVMLHVASLLALVAYFRKDLRALAQGVFSGDPKARRLTLYLAVATVPAAAAGLLLADYFEGSFEDAEASAIQLIATAFILVGGELALSWHLRRRAKEGGTLRGIDDLTLTDAGVIGVAQAISILPGISRSGSTIASGLALGIGRDDSARFAFLLAIPALFGAALVKVPELADSSLGVSSAVGGFLASLIFSYAAVAILIRYLKTRTLYPFAAYCVVAGVLFLAII
jgi:undecaprenyl-diphosphatase